MYHVCQAKYRKALEKNDWVVEPRIPRGLAKFEDDKTPRICLASSISKCIAAREGTPLERVKFKRPKEPLAGPFLNLVLRPQKHTKTLAATCRVVTKESYGERWVLKPTRMVLVGEILSTIAICKRTHKVTHYWWWVEN